MKTYKLILDLRGKLPQNCDSPESVMYSDVYAVKNGNQVMLYEDIDGDAPQRVIAIYEEA